MYICNAMTTLPEEFLRQTRSVLGKERMERFLHAFDEEAPVSIRLNPRKTTTADGGQWKPIGGEPVAWCTDGYYLPVRPSFTMDPLLHGGLYYVQEAASMFLSEVVQQLMPSLLRLTDGRNSGMALDLCAAPGGKSTLLRSVLPEDWLLVSNEPVPLRAQILAENMAKWGYERSVVTNNYPRDFSKGGCTFNLIVCDAPCSGEGMFRKDKATIGEWSMENVERCRRLQRDIVTEAWKCLRDDGVMVYSTCTLNTHENEEQVAWMTEELGAVPIEISTREDWHVTGSLSNGLKIPVYRFIPGISRGEGLFVAVLQKGTHHGTTARPQRTMAALKKMKVLADGGYPAPTTKGHTTVPHPAEALFAGMKQGNYPTAELNYAEAMAYLRREALTLSAEVPRGIVAVTFKGVPLGFVKNIGNRANNLYPEKWKIKTTHIPTDYEAILRHT